MRAFSSPTIRDFISDLRIRALSHIKWAFVFPGTALLPLRNQSSLEIYLEIFIVEPSNYNFKISLCGSNGQRLMDACLTDANVDLRIVKEN
ncbi:hypothetical protein TNCT_432562 [Trichonephila clavata]|uniref:Uncharacterized protein n=1 Tax=Trichonephila clavata TaxID=2740835 RepID=A0A8X6EZ75_TRICU|nr:hypothetical protein TNCT_432562 [Trichonephila clavata]